MPNYPIALFLVKSIIPAGVYLFKVNNANTRRMSEIRSFKVNNKDIITRGQGCRSGVFIVDCPGVFIVDFVKVLASWACSRKKITALQSRRSRSYSGAFKQVSHIVLVFPLLNLNK